MAGGTCPGPRAPRDPSLRTPTFWRALPLWPRWHAASTSHQRGSGTGRARQWAEAWEDKLKEEQKGLTIVCSPCGPPT